MKNTNTLIVELRHQNNTFPNVPNSSSRLYLEFGTRGIMIQLLLPGEVIPVKEINIGVPFTTRIDFMFLDEKEQAEIPMELVTINGEQVYIAPEAS
jgi:hypothetical protein